MFKIAKMKMMLSQPVENNDKRNRNLSALRKDIEFEMKKKKQIIGAKFLQKTKYHTQKSTTLKI